MNKAMLAATLFAQMKNAALPADRVRAMQEERLRRILLHAWKHAPYYRRTFAQAGITTAEQVRTLPLSAFPTTDKAAVMENYRDVLTSGGFGQEELRRFDAVQPGALFRGQYHVVHSSGSTGVPRYFLYDRDAWLQAVSGEVRGVMWGLTPGEIGRLLTRRMRILYIAATNGSYGGAMTVADGAPAAGASLLMLDINEPLAHWVDKVRAFRPNVVMGYPSALKILGSQLERAGLALDVLRVASGGEPLSPSVRAYLEGLFHVPVSNVYAASESMALGVETNPAQGMFLFDDLNRIEVENGRMYLTSLYNTAQPLIRYRMSDRLTLLPARESGCGFTRCRVLPGRGEDVFWLEDEQGRTEFLHPLALEDFCIPGLLDYQFIQQTPRDIRVLVQTTADADRTAVSDRLSRGIQQVLDRHCLDFVTFGLHFVREIPPDPRTGKKRLAIPLERTAQRFSA